MQLTIPIAITQVPTSVAIMQVLRFYCNFQVVLSTKIMLVDHFVAIMQVTVSVAIMQLEVSAAFAKVSTANMWVTILLKLCIWETLLQ